MTDSDLPFTWRPATPADLPALEALQRAVHGAPLNRWSRARFEYLFTPPLPASVVTRCAIDPAGRLVAFASATVYSIDSEHRGDLDVLLHPDLADRTLESTLLHWAEERARDLLAALPPDSPSLLRLAFTDGRDQVLYPRHGFRFSLASDIMGRDLHDPIPDLPLPAGCTLLTWTDERAPLFYQLYRDAFHARPGFTDWPEATWRRIRTGSPAFRPDLSILLKQGDTPAGYALCWIDDAANQQLERAEGWYVEAGVRPDRQGHGLGTHLFLSTLRAFRAAGMDDALLEVNANNPAARRLYERLGFRWAARLTVYTRPI